MMVCLFGGTSSLPDTYGKEQSTEVGDAADNTLVLADWLKCNMSTKVSLG